MECEVSLRTSENLTLTFTKADIWQRTGCFSPLHSLITNSLSKKKKKKEKNANNSSHIRYFCFESKVTMYAATLEALESSKQYILQHYSFLPEVFKTILFTNCHKQKWREKILLYPSQKYNHPREQLNKISQCLALMKLQIIWGS